MAGSVEARGESAAGFGVTGDEQRAMDRAFDLAGQPGFRSGGNPRVGCVLLSANGERVAEGWHRGAGNEHAEAMAVRCAGSLARGSTAVVTLEPCNHTGRTGPCTELLIESGVRRVVFAQIDPDPVAGGGASVLRVAGVEAIGPVAEDRGHRLNPMWSLAVGRGRPFVILKLAASLDGRIAAADGSSRWVTGPEARREVRDLRATVDAVMVGTGTVLADDPSLTVRPAPADGSTPLRVVVGERDLPPGARILDRTADHLHLRTRNLRSALGRLYERGVRSVLVEGGARLATSLLREQLVDRLDWYVAPILLGDSGVVAVGDLGIASIDGCLRWAPESVRQLGDDVAVRLRPSQVAGG